MIFAEVARGLGGRDVNKPSKYQPSCCYVVRSLTDIPVILRVIPRHFQIKIDFDINNNIIKHMYRSGPEVIKNSCSTQLSMNYVLLINV